MTKRVAAALLLLALAPLVPDAAAHGAATAREVDTRVLLDDDGALPFAGCGEAGCPPSGGLDSGAVDLLALDVREFRAANGTAMLGFRVTFQAEAERQEGRSIVIRFTTNLTHLLRLEGDGVAFTSADADRVFLSPDTIGDGHAKAVEAWVAQERVGAKAGGTLTGIQLYSYAGTTKGDFVPGSWYAANEQTVPVPWIPEEQPDNPNELVAPTPGSYALKGPADLLTMAVNKEALEIGHGSGTLTVTLANPLTTLPQFVSLRAAGGNLTVAADAAAVNLDPGASKTITLTVRGETALLDVTASSDLGGFATRPVYVTATHAAPTNTTASTTTTGAKKSPSVEAPFLALGLAALAVARRRW